MSTTNLPAIHACRPAWNKGRIVGQKRPLLPRHVWAIRVRLEIADRVRDLAAWLANPMVVGSQYLWPSRFHERLHISTRQYARLVRDWVTSIGLEPSADGTHSMRRTKVAQIYRKTGNLRAVQLLLGHTKMDSTVRYLGVELEDALAIAEAVEV